jgi:hypothetical protein
VTFAVLLNRDFAQEHAANIRCRTAPAQEVEFALHVTFEATCAPYSAITNFDTKELKNIFQLSNLG